MRRLAVTLFLAVLVAPLGGCARSPDARSRMPVTASAKSLRMDPREFRVRVRAQIRPVLGLIEEGVDEVLAQVTDEASRRRAVNLKIEATSTLLSAMLRDDPLLALADSWGYILQLLDFAESPEVRERYGPLADDLERTLERVRVHLFAFAEGVQDDLSAAEFEDRLREWAAENPIEGSVRRRPSMDEAIADLFPVPASRGAFAAIGGLDETTAEIMTRMDLYTAYLPRLARWEAELALLDVAGGVDPGEVASDVERIRGAADRIAGAAEGIDEIIASERSAALEALRDERLAATADLREGREAILAAVRAERIATLEAIEAAAERLLDRSAEPLHAAVRDETDRLVGSVEEMRSRLIDDAGDILREVVDHAFWRALQLLLIAAALAAVGVVLHTRFLRSRGPG